MSVSLIVTVSIDRNFNENGKQIALDDWLAIVKRDPALMLRSEPYVMRLPDGGELSMPVHPGQTEMLVDGQRIPFLGYQDGQLSMKFTDEMEDPGDLRRKKVAEIARQLGALVTHDAGDEILDW
jgi:hypothetical protein